MRIRNFEIDQGRTFIIAEIGGNHEGNFKQAKRMIQEAARNGADAVKFQIFRSEKLVSPHSKKRAYSGVTHQQQLQRFRKLEFTRKQYQELKKTADKNRILFLASVFDAESTALVDDLLPAYKIASGDLTYRAFLKWLRKKGKPMLLSTGAATFMEIKRAVNWIGKRNLVILHCVCSYPAPDEEMNLRSIPFLREKLKVPIGISDHSIGIVCAVAAVALGACVVEKHFTLNKNIPFGDHKLSVDPTELRKMVEAIRTVEKAKGIYGRPALRCEEKARNLVRRSLFVKRDLKRGHLLTRKDLIALRPLEGIPVEEEGNVLGKSLKQPVTSGSPLTAMHLTERDKSV